MNAIFGFDIFAFDFVLLLVRIALGGFFVLARFRFFHDPSQPHGDRWLCDIRHNSLTNKMCHCGWKRFPYFWAWFAAGIEVFAGLGVLFGLLTTLSAVGLLAITIAATFCTFRDKVIVKQKPVDKVDVCSCYLWTVEPLYILMAIILVVAGPGRYSIDNLIWGPL